MISTAYCGPEGVQTPPKVRQAVHTFVAAKQFDDDLQAGPAKLQGIGILWCRATDSIDFRSLAPPGWKEHEFQTQTFVLNHLLQIAQSSTDKLGLEPLGAPWTSTSPAVLRCAESFCISHCLDLFGIADVVPAPGLEPVGTMGPRPPLVAGAASFVQRKGRFHGWISMSKVPRWSNMGCPTSNETMTVPVQTYEKKLLTLCLSDWTLDSEMCSLGLSCNVNHRGT
eukprot:s1980_g13.t1